MNRLTTKRWLWLIILLSVALRVGAALFMGNGDVVALPGTADQVSYHNLALRVLDGHGFSFGENWWPATKADTPTAHWSFLYTFYLIAVYAIVGVQPLVARLLQAVAVGVLQPWLAYYLAGRVLAETSWSAARRERIALIAAGVTAVYIYFVYYSASLMTEPFYGVGVLATLALALTVVQRADRPRIWPTALLFAVSMTATVLLRQLFMLVLPFIYLWMLWAVVRRGGKQGSLRGPAVLPRQVVDSPRLGPAAHACRLDVEDVARLQGYGRARVVQRRDALVQAEGRGDLRAQPAVIVDVLIAERLLQHEQVERVERLQRGGVGQGVGGVGVEHQRDVGELGAHGPR